MNAREAVKIINTYAWLECIVTGPNGWSVAGTPEKCARFIIEEFEDFETAGFKVVVE